MEDKWLSQNQAAKLFKISRSKIQRMLRDGLISLNKNGKISYLKLKAALEAEREAEETKQRSLSELNMRLKMAQVKYREEKARLAELERKAKEGELVPVEQVIKEWGEKALTIKSILLSWTNKLPPLLEKKSKSKIKEILDEQVREILEVLSQGVESTAKEN